MRCKFKCTQVTEFEGGYKKYDLQPVFSNDPNHENKKFWDSSPSGQFNVTVKNPNVSMTVGREYYIDVTEAPPSNP